MNQAAVVDNMYKPNQQSEVEPSPHWVRVQLAGEYVADSKRVLLLRQAGKLPEYAFHPDDVNMDLLETTGEPKIDARNGRLTFYNVNVNGAVAEHAAWRYDAPPAEWAALQGYVGFKWNKMDHWYEESEEVFVHPRDPYKRVDATQYRTPSHVRTAAIPGLRNHDENASIQGRFS